MEVEALAACVDASTISISSIVKSKDLNQIDFNKIRKGSEFAA